MGIFSGDNVAIYSGSIDNTTFEGLMEDASIDVDGMSDDIQECAYNAIMDINENYSNFMGALALNELNSIETTGQEFVYTEGVLGDFASKIKAFLLKIWEKIKSLFKHALMIFNSYSKTDKEFVNKYKQELSKAATKDLSDFVFKGYSYNNLTEGKVSAAITVIDNAKDVGEAAAGSDATVDYKKLNDNFSDDMEKLRGLVVGAISKDPGSLTADEFNKELYSALRGDMDEKEELDDIDVHKLMNELTSSADDKKVANRAFRDSKKVIDKAIKDAEKNERTYTKENVPVKGNDEDKKEKVNNTVKSYSYGLKWMRESKSLLISLDAAVLNTIKERSRQNKACLIKIVHYKPKNEGAYVESGNFVSGSNFLSGIELK